MAYSLLPTRTSADPNSAADVNQLQENITTRYNSFGVSDDYSLTAATQYHIIEIDSTNTAPSITLPTISAFLGRSIKLWHIKQANSNTVTINRSGADAMVDSLTSVELPVKDNYVDFYASSLTNAWEFLDEKITCQLRLQGYNGYGGTETKIMQFSNTIENIGNMFTENHTSGYAASASGLNVTIKKSGKYSAGFDAQGTGASVGGGGISKNTSQTTISIASITATNRLKLDHQGTTNFYGSSVEWSGYLEKGDIIRPHTSGLVPATFPEICQFVITYLGK
jgi:hypothetical protein